MKRRIYNLRMGNSVKLRTAVPSVAEFGKSLGISQKRQRALISLVNNESDERRLAMRRKESAGVAKAAGSEKVSRAAKR